MQDACRSALLAAVAAALLVGCGRQPPAEDDGGYAGSESCRECHEKFYKLWSQSHHGRAMQPYSDGFAASNLTRQTEAVLIDGVEYRAHVSAGEGYMTEGGQSDGKRHKIVHVMGGKNVFFFLTPMQRGRLQVMPLAYKLSTKQWYDTTASMVRHFELEEDAPIHWTDQLLTFNTACFNCHVSQLRKNYDLASDTYKTVWKEPGINCETCHGPAEEHSRVCREAKGGPPEDLKLLSWRTLSIEQQNDACSGCHAKAAQVTPAFVPGEKFFDHYDLTCLEDHDFYPDGRDLGENYTLTGWMMSPCADSGRLACIHCHTSSGRYRFKQENPSGACVSCHAERVAGIEEHSRHKMGGDNAPTCVDCHMPMTDFSHMNRSDHSMRPPSPAASIEFGSPNACTICHDDKDGAWAAAEVAQWHPESRWRKRIIREGRLVRWARKEQWEHLDEILAYLQEEEADDVVAVSLVRLLFSCRDARKQTVLQGLLQHPSPLVRSAAAVAVGAHDMGAVHALLPLLDDEYRLVRVRAAGVLMSCPRNLLPAAGRRRLEEVESELVASMASRPDHWSSHYNFGNHWTQLGRTAKAMEAYELAIRMRGDIIPPYVNAAVLASQLDNQDKAYRYLRKAYELGPKDGAVNLNLGLLMAERGDLAAAEKHLRIAMADVGSMPQAAYNLAVIVGSRDPGEAARLCRQALDAVPGNRKYRQAMEHYLKQEPR